MKRALPVLLCAAFPVLASAQDAGDVAHVSRDPSTLRVFLDCGGGGSFGACNSNDYRTEIRFVDWVRDRADADVHIILTSQSTGSGQQHSFDFIGQGELLDGLSDRLAYRASSTNTRDETVRGLTQVLRAGLVRYVAHAGLTDRVLVAMAEGRGDDDSAAPPAQISRDPWNAWVFRTGFDMNVSGEERENEHRVSGNLSANRTTDQWKMSMEARANSRSREVELNDGETFVDDNRDWSAGILVVRSLGPRWATGSQVEFETAPNSNRSRASRASYALEWNFFPYEEANRRQLLVHYQLGVQNVAYEERTVFGHMQETVTDQLFNVNYNTRQPWGTASFFVQWSNYLHDFSLNRGSVDGNLSFRILRGVDLNLRGSYERIRDQINLSADGLSDAEILVRRGVLATGYEYEFSAGMSYRFGSIFNNVVNNRFPRRFGGGR
jgi:hypothetical protein